jgi:hypothetical protein
MKKSDYQAFQSNKEERVSGNRRNGYTGKHIQSSLGKVTVHPSR